MKAFLATTCILSGALLAGGCATKKYVRNTAAPIQAKVDQVGEQTQRQGQTLDETRTEVKQVDERATSGINAAKERAMTAENRANDAMNRANQANDTATKATDLGNKNASELSSLRQVVSNLDDYKLQTQATVPFKFDQAVLNNQAKQELDKIAQDVQNDKRYFIAVEGFTDRTGGKQYNEALSRRRADAVVQYLVAKHDVPIYRIHMIGLGDQKPADEGRNRAARAKNRRVEVRVFSADQAMAMNQPNGATQNQQNMPATNSNTPQQ